LKLKWEKR